MDNVQDLPQVQSSHSHPHTGSVLKVKQLNPSSMSGEEMKALWERVSTQDYAFDDLTRNDPSALALGLVTPASYHFVINDAAYVICRNVWKDSNADLHFIVWDQSLPFRDIIEAGRQILEVLFKEKGVCRVSGYIAKFNPLAMRFATTMGFKYEGTMRQSFKYHEQFYDIDIYGLLPKEFERRFHQ